MFVCLFVYYLVTTLVVMGGHVLVHLMRCAWWLPPHASVLRSFEPSRNEFYKKDFSLITLIQNWLVRSLQHFQQLVKNKFYSYQKLF